MHYLKIYGIKNNVFVFFFPIILEVKLGKILKKLHKRIIKWPM